jgi:hypothetical protein
VVCYKVEPATASTAALHHVATGTLLSMSVRSNTGIERTRDLTPPATAASAAETSSGGGSDAGADATARVGGAAAVKSMEEVADEGTEELHEPASEAKHRERAKCFADWLVAQFPWLLEGARHEAAERLDETVEEEGGVGGGGDDGVGDAAVRAAADVGKGGVLDVAGGKGELSLFLTLAGVPCTLVDPRPSSGFLSRWQRKLLRRSGKPPFEVVRELFGDAGGEASAKRAREAGLIVGMHPDEVTEAIVDAAIRAGTPFAVVPCCVFTRLFPARRLRSGAPVTTHAQLCTYLREKAPGRIGIRTLPFAGKNTVVYSLPESLPEHRAGSQTRGQGAGAGEAEQCEPCA